MADAWLMIDAVHRLRQLLLQLPGLRQKERELQVFFRNTETVENLRKFVQHFSSGIESFVAVKTPLWGILSWTEVWEDGVGVNFIIIPGTGFYELHAAGTPINVQTGEYAERIALGAGGEHRVDLARLFERVAVLARWFDRWYKDHFEQTEPVQRHVIDMLILIFAIPTHEDQPTDQDSRVDQTKI
jgi:hypothetical protein